jgi:hypothetical protein
VVPVELKTRRLEWSNTPKPLGRHVEHDARSLEYPARRGSRPLGIVEWAINAGVLDQGEVGRCTGYSAATCMNSAPYYGERRKVNKGRYLTAAHGDILYHNATINDAFPGVWKPDDTGSTGLAVAKALQDLGLISSYRHCFGIDHVLDAIVLGPMIVGTAWLEDMFELPSNRILSVTGDEAGGHEYCLHKADFRREVLWFRQTWEGWKDFGIRFDDFDRLLRNDGDATVLVGSVP